jgi:hypothetical protein
MVTVPLASADGAAANATSAIAADASFERM